MKNHNTTIEKETDYKNVMKKIDSLMSKGSNNVTKSELSEIRELALMAQAYEKQNFVIKPPSTLAGIIEMKMYEMRLKQTEVAQKLEVSNAKLSLIMNGKQRPDVAFLKSVHKQLHVDANLLLEVV
jgi:HTH-type transcriptional regulator/antitoxin HigA